MHLLLENNIRSAPFIHEYQTLRASRYTALLELCLVLATSVRYFRQLLAPCINRPQRRKDSGTFPDGCNTNPQMRLKQLYRETLASIIRASASNCPPLRNLDSSTRSSYYLNTFTIFEIEHRFLRCTLHGKNFHDQIRSDRIIRASKTKGRTMWPCSLNVKAKGIW